MLRILKFGGTSMGTARAIAQSARITARAARRGQVVSALAGVTNELIALIDLAEHEHTEAVQERVRALEGRHHALWNAFADDAAEGMSWDERMVPLFEKLRLLLTGTSLVGDISDRSFALICAFGERFSSRIMQRALSRESCRCAMVDAGELIVTDAQYREVVVDFPASQRRFRSALRPLLRHGIVPVLPGFIGEEPSGHTTLLGRGGSDYSASIAGIGLHADVVEIWTDVDGIMSADPRLVKRGVRTWRTVELAAMLEMAHSGANVLHPKTITAAVQKKIPEINGEAALGVRLIAKPNCTTTIAAMAANPLHRAFRVKRMIVSTYQSASGAGGKGMTELWEQTKNVLDDKPAAHPVSMRR